MLPFFSLLLLAGLSAPALPSASGPLDFDTAFADHSRGGPLHFVAHYVDARGTNHRLEVWRVGDLHLRRKTDDRIDLHADVTSKPRPGVAPEYLWQVVDLEKKIDNRINSRDLLEAGMFYNFWSMAHVLLRPSGNFTVAALPASTHSAPAPGLPACRWYALTSGAQPASHICWSAEMGAPVVILSEQKDGSFRPAFQMDSADHGPVGPAIFRVDTRGLQVRDVAQFADHD